MFVRILTAVLLALIAATSKSGTGYEITVKEGDKEATYDVKFGGAKLFEQWTTFDPASKKFVFSHCAEARLNSTFGKRDSGRLLNRKTLEQMQRILKADTRSFADLSFDDLRNQGSDKRISQLRPT